MTVFKKKNPFKGDQVKMRPLGLSPNPTDWRPYKKKFGHRITEGRPSEDTGKRLLSKQRDLRRNQALTLDLQPLESSEKLISVV